jgi:carboxyvinyl-carboxyphosphonate phosphorylmutase
MIAGHHAPEREDGHYPPEKGTPMRITTTLRQMLNGPGLIVAPGAYDGFSARLIEAAGFKAVYMTGAGTAASHLGQPDLGLTTLTEMATHAGHIASCVSLPVIADADTGYGNALNVVRTVREYERAGVAGLHLEDQVAPKRCGHIAGKQIIPAREFADKIRAAAEYRSDPDFVIIARTDARAVTSLDDAIERGNQYAEAGADVIFVEAPQTEDEIQRVAREVKAPLLANMVPGGRTPAVKVAELERLGFKIVIFPGVCMAAAVPAMERALARLKETGTDWHEGPVLGPIDLFRKVGFDWWHAIEQKFTGA